jgi:hypothetical protein
MLWWAGLASAMSATQIRNARTDRTRMTQRHGVLAGDHVARVAAVVAAIGFAGIAIFQLALAAGAPWGHAAWGGANAHLSTAQRSASAAAVVFYAAAALIVLGRAGMLRARGNAALFRWGIWFLAVAMAIGALPNFASQRRWENFIFGPLALVLAILCVVVARRAATGQARDSQRIERE